MSMEKTITMPLAEYEELIENSKNMTKALKEKGSIPFEFVSQNMAIGFTRNAWNIVTKDEMIVKLLDEIKLLCKQKDGLYNELCIIKNTNKKSSCWLERMFNK